MQDEIKQHLETLNRHAENLADHAERLADHENQLKTHGKQIESLEINVRGIYQIIESFRSMFQSAETLWSSIADDVRIHKFVDGILIVFSIVGLVMMGVLLMSVMK